jgi:predicted SAM-dependent methyltransferase
MKLNLGCGLQKLEGYVNVDIDPNLKPDEVFDFTRTFPYADESVEEIVAYHVLEHLPKHIHRSIYSEIYRVLVPSGRLVISFPEFLACVENWKTNHKGMRDFWEATLYGRQSSPHDYHVCIMDREMVARELIRCGFGILYKGPEPVEQFNSVIKAEKFQKYSYQEAMAETIYADSRPK